MDTALRLAVALSFAAAFTCQADISVSISKPTSGATTTGTLLVQASVSSLYELSSVTASVEDRQTNLVFSGALNAWTSTLLLDGLARGPKTLLVVAHDVFGNTNQAQQAFFVDNPPSLVVIAPLNGTVARPQIYIEATATDDDPVGTVINVYNTYDRPESAPLLLRGTNTVKGVISIITSRSPLLFEAVDSVGNRRYIARQVLLESSSNLIERATAPGPILDVTPDRFLYTSSPDVPVSGPLYLTPYVFGKPEARILHRMTGIVSGLAGDFLANLSIGLHRCLAGCIWLCPL